MMDNSKKILSDKQVSKLKSAKNKPLSDKILKEAEEKSNKEILK